MEITVSAFLPWKINDKMDRATVTNGLTLLNDQLIGFAPMAENIQDWGFNKIGRQKYSYMLLHKAQYEKLFHDSGTVIEIAFLKEGVPTKVYIDKKHLCNLMWMNKECWIQKDGNLKWVIGMIVSFGVGLFISWYKFKCP